jgi:hypothetical protein
MYRVAVSTKTAGGQDVTAVLECADRAAVASTAEAAFDRAVQAATDVVELQKLADEEGALRKRLLDDRATVDALEKAAAVNLLPAAREKLANDVARMEEIKLERATINERNA